MSNNEIGLESVIAIAEALKSECCNLTSLDLRGNNIEEEGAIALVEVLNSEYCTVTRIDLSGDNIVEAALKKLWNHEPLLKNKYTLEFMSNTSDSDHNGRKRSNPDDFSEDDYSNDQPQRKLRTDEYDSDCTTIVGLNNSDASDPE
jgi:hypothetical protein